MKHHEQSDRSNQIVEEYADEAQRCYGARAANFTPPLVNVPSRNDYTVMLEEYLGLPLDDILPDKLLRNRLKDIDRDSHLKENYPEGVEIHLGIIPFTTSGSRLSDEEIADGDYLKQLVRYNGMTSGFTLFPTGIHELMPENVRGCTFRVDKYDKPDNFQITTEDRERIKARYTETYHRLQQALRGQ